tara:strand:- start:7021 stop:7602 length:582 start_codon:yes stop_codon:yes gene_type:complete
MRSDYLNPNSNVSKGFQKLSDMHLEIVDVTPTLSATTYENKDLMWQPATITNAVASVGNASFLHSITMTQKIDADNQTDAIDLFFFGKNPTSVTGLGLADTADSIETTDSEQKMFLDSEFLGKVPLSEPTLMPSTGAANGAAYLTVTNIGLPLQSTSGSKDVYFIGVMQDKNTTDPLTYADGDLLFRFGIMRD